MTVEVGELRARLTAEAQQIKAEIRAVKKDLSDLGEQAKKADGSFDGLNEALKQIGLSSEQIKKISKEIRDTNPKILEKQLSEVEKQLKALGVESKQIEKIKNQLVNAETEAKQAAKGIGSIETALTALGAGTAVVGLAKTIHSLTEDALALSRAYGGLTEVSKALNVKVDESTGLAEKLADRWGLSKTALADTVKTYLTAGLTLQQVEEIIVATADAAVYNREAHLSWDEAIRQVAQGVKMGNSELTDAAGITTNLSVMQDRYAKSIGTTADKLTEAQKIQAAYNGIVKESAIFAGNADSAMTGYTGTQATFNQTMQTARVELGEAFLPLLEELMETITPIITGFSKWAGGNKEVVAGLGAAAITVGSLIAIMTTLITVVGALSAAFTALNISIGPIGWAIAGVSALAAGVVAYEVASDKASGSVWKLAQSQDELIKKLSESPMKRNTSDVKKMEEDLNKINDLMRERSRLEDQLRGASVNAMGKYKGAIREINDELAVYGIKTAEDAARVTAKLRSEINKSVPALLELNKVELADIATKVEHADRMEQLVERYKDLDAKQQLDAAQKNEMLSIFNQLKKEYPSLNGLMDEEGRIHAENIGAISDRISKEKELTKATASEVQGRLILIQQETKARKTQVDASLANMKSYMDAFEKAKADGTLNHAMVRSAAMASESYSKLVEEANSLTETDNKIDDWLAKIKDGNYKDFIPSNPLAGMDSAPSSIDKKAAELRRKAFEEEISIIRYKTEMYNWSADEQISAYEKVLTKHKTYLAEAPDDERMIQLQIKQIREDVAQASFDFSMKWIEREKYYKRLSLQEELDAYNRVAERYEEGTERREQAEREIFRVKAEMEQDKFSKAEESIEAEERHLREKQATEIEIANMQLLKWTELRNQYEANTEFYKQADLEIYKAKMKLIEETKKAEEEAAKEREKQIDDITDETLKAIKKMEQAELDSIDKKKREIEDSIDEQIDEIDEEQRSKDKAELLAQREKYLHATSREGRAKLAEIEKQLAKMEADEKKRQLEREKKEKLRNLDDQRDAVEDYYDELEEAFKASAGNIEAIEKLMQDNRLKFLQETNKEMLKKLEEYVNEYNRINSQKKDGGGSSSGGTKSGSSGGSTGSSESVIDQMQKNSDDWHDADPDQKDKLEKTNEELGESIGLHKTDDGVWRNPDGTPAYHTGGIAGVMNFRSGDELMPDEISAILRIGEPVLTAKQISSLLTSQTPGKQAPSITNNYNAPLIAHDGDVKLEDDADVRTYWSERELAVQRLLAGGDR